MKTYFSKEIKITVFKQRHLDGMIDIDSEEYEFNYSNPIQELTGLQSNLDSWHERLLNIQLEKIKDAAKEIDLIFKHSK